MQPSTTTRSASVPRSKWRTSLPPAPRQMRAELGGLYPRSGAACAQDYRSLTGNHGRRSGAPSATHRSPVIFFTIGLHLHLAR